MELLIQNLRDPLAAPLTIAVCALSGALNVLPPSRRALGVAVAVLAILAPWVASSDASLVRCLCAGATSLAVFRNLDLFRDPRRWSATRRALHTICPFDSRRLQRTGCAVDRASWLRSGAFGVLSFLAAWMLTSNGVQTELSSFVARWIWGALWVYASVETVAALATATLRLGGVRPPKLHDDPILSRTLLEFWGRRWNLSVQRMLHDHCFRPLARRVGIPVAILGTFAGSAVLHLWLVLAAGGTLMALSIASFFVLQGLLVIAEQTLGVRSWRRPLQHVWSLRCVLLPLPLLLEPLLRVVFS